MDLLVLIAILVLAVGSGIAVFVLLQGWSGREKPTEEPTIEKLEKDLKELEAKYHDLAKRFKKIKAFDKAQLELIRRIIQDELRRESKRSTRKSIWINAAVSFLVSVFVLIIGLVIQKRFFG